MRFSGVELNGISSTKEKIFYVAIDMFATNGFAAVSMRDIAEAVGIKPASIYNHFASKDAILAELITFITETTHSYYKRLGEMIKGCECLEDVFESLFAELEHVRDISIYYGVTLLSSEQFKNESAGAALNNIHMQGGIDFISGVFEDCIEKGWMKPVDANALATFIMCSVFTGSILRVKEDMGQSGFKDAKSMFSSLKLFLLDVLRP